MFMLTAVMLRGTIKSVMQTVVMLSEA
jgi:hypothetical protein